MQIFNKFHLFKFSESFKILLQNINNIKNIFNKTFPKAHFTIEIAKVRPIFGHKINFTVNTWKLSTATEKTNGFW